MEYSDDLDIQCNSVTYSSVDVETTGLSAEKNRVIEIGIAKIKDGKLIDRYGSYINPGCYIPEQITEITGITDEDVEMAPKFADVAQEVFAFMEGTVVVGHNLQFDMGFLRHEFQKAGIEHFQPLSLCTLRLARRMYPELKSKSLGSVAHHLQLKTDTLHRALEDAELTAQVLMRQMKQLEKQGIQTLKDLINFQFTASAPFTMAVKKPKLMSGLAVIPDSPGVYYFLNEKKQIVYIGKAKSLHNRLRSYISPSAIGKTKRIFKKADQVKVQQTSTELTAFLLEAELIKLIGPRMNVQLKKYREKYFLKIDNANPFPALTITNDILFDGNDYFGLFISKRKAAELFELINKIFALRECTDKEMNKGKRCFLSEIERCTAPCENDDIDMYQAELTRVFDFMAGKNQTALDRLLKRMKKYSDDLKFEKAQEVKETIQLIMSQIQKSALLTEPVNRANVLFEVTHSPHRTDYILLLQGKVYVNNYLLNTNRNFMTALEDYYSGVINRAGTPDDEDLEKMKITLNWIIKNRHQVSVYYLKEYKSVSHLAQSLQWKLQKNLEIPEITITAEDFFKK